MKIKKRTGPTEWVMLCELLERAYKELVIWRDWSKGLEYCDMADAGRIKSPDKKLMEQIRVIVGIEE